MTAVDAGTCGRRSLSGISVCDQPAGHAGLHIDSAQDTSFQIQAGPHDPTRANPGTRLPAVPPADESPALDQDVICVLRLPVSVRALDLVRRAIEVEYTGATITQRGRYLTIREAHG